MAKIEEFVIVDDDGYIKRFSSNKRLEAQENLAVELVIVYLRRQRQIVLFNRGSGASDMHDHWALEAGKICADDLFVSKEDKLDTRITLREYQRSATREFIEELDFSVNPQRFEFVEEFHMPEKQLFFALLSLSIEEDEVRKLSPDQSEVDRVKRFTLEEFQSNPDLGDAIVFRKDAIVQYLQNEFGKRQEIA